MQALQARNYRNKELRKWQNCSVTIMACYGKDIDMHGRDHIYHFLLHVLLTISKSFYPYRRICNNFVNFCENVLAILRARIETEIDILAHKLTFAPITCIRKRIHTWRRDRQTGLSTLSMSLSGLKMSPSQHNKPGLDPSFHSTGDTLCADFQRPLKAHNRKSAIDSWLHFLAGIAA